jgi:hypothetical protein
MSKTDNEGVIFGEDDDTPKPEQEEPEDGDVNDSVDRNAEAMAEDAPEPSQQDVSSALDKEPEQPEDERKLDEFFEEMSKDQIYHFIGDRLENEEYGEFADREMFLEACLKAEKMTQDRSDVKDFIEKRASEEETDATQVPVYSNSEDQAAWINKDSNGNEYLSIKVSDGEYVNLFPQTDLQRDALRRQHEVNKSK